MSNYSEMNSKPNQVRLQVIHRYAWRYLVIVLCLLSTSCTATLISGYDAQTDQAVTALQRKIETFFVTLQSQPGSPETLYENNESFYRESKIDVSALKLRTSAIPDNTLTEQQIELLEQNLNLLEEYHRDGVIVLSAIEVVREDFNTSLSAILKLELAKKRGAVK